MDLTPLMKPTSVAVVGASQRMGRGTRVIENLQRFGYAGRIFPINPKYREILGLPCYPDLDSTPEPAEMVVVAIPAEQVPGLLAAAADRGARGAVILSSGFAEAGPRGLERQAALERLTAERGLLVCGPNCYGVFNIRWGSATFSADFSAPPRPGRLALISQSGGFSHAVAEHLMQQRSVGLSYIVSCGNQAGVTIEDYLEFLIEDGDTDVIGVFVEGFKQPEQLRPVAARARQAHKPIVALKVGRSENARQAMLAHTGSLAGTPEIIDAVLRQSAIVQATSLNEMIDTLTLLAAARRFRRHHWRVAVLSGLGGECSHVADAADRAGIDLPPLSASSVESIGRFMPDFATPRNPLDGTGAMYENPALFPQLVDVLLRDEAIDVVAINLRANVPKPGGWAPSRQFSQIISTALRGGTDKLVLAFNSFAGGDLDQQVVGPLAEVGVPFLDGTETALLALRHAREYRRSLDRAGEGNHVETAKRAIAPGAPPASTAMSPRARRPRSAAMWRPIRMRYARVLCRRTGAVCSRTPRLCACSASSGSPWPRRLSRGIRPRPSGGLTAWVTPWCSRSILRTSRTRPMWAASGSAAQTPPRSDGPSTKCLPTSAGERLRRVSTALSCSEWSPAAPR
jgi:acyl-CoA synthetase (NDP forming)